MKVFYIKVRQTEERISVATKSTQLNVGSIIFLSSLGSFFRIIVDLLDYLLSFYCYHWIIILKHPVNR